MIEIIEWINQNWFGGAMAPWVVQLVAYISMATVLFVVAPIQMLFFTMYERRAIARMQDRIGPNRVGPEGAFQPVADAVKMFTKEDIVPDAADPWVHLLAPCVVVAPTMLMFAVIPWGPGMTAAPLPVGALYFVAISSISAVGLMMAGWGSNNKFALLGTMRAVAQMVSYEIPLVLAVLTVVLLAGTMNTVDIVTAQAGLPFVGGLASLDLGLGWFVFTPVGLLAFICFFIAALAEGERTPFDIPEADSEIVAGYMTEYSGMKFGLFYLAQYVLNFLLCAFTATLLFGGWNGPGVPQLLAMGVSGANPDGNVWFNVAAGVLGVFYFLLKTYSFFFVMIWVRGALPRLRVDQLMSFGWKFLIPLALINIFSAAIWVALMQWGPDQWALIQSLGAPGSWPRWGVAFVVTAVLNLAAFWWLVRVNSHPEITDPAALAEEQSFGALTLP